MNTANTMTQTEKKQSRYFEKGEKEKAIIQLNIAISVIEAFRDDFVVTEFFHRTSYDVWSEKLAQYKKKSME